MGRIRTVKPEFWRHEVLSALPPETHMLAAALINYADDEGYFNAHPGLVKAECMPLREPSVSIHDSLCELSKIGFIQMAKGSDGKTYGRVVKFADHQRVNRPTPSKIKQLVVFTESSVSHQCDVVDESQPELGSRNLEVGTGNREREHEKHCADAPADKSAKVSVTANDLVKTYGIDKDMAAQWLAVRKDKRMKLTPLAMDKTIAECKKAGITLSAAVKLCCENSWAGFKAEYLANLPQSESPQAADPLISERKELKYERQQIYSDIRQLEALSLPVPDEKRRRLSVVEQRLREIGN